MGTWKLNEAKSKWRPRWVRIRPWFMRPKGEDEGDGGCLDKDGKPTHSVWVGKFDATAYPVKGNLPYDAVMYKVVNDRPTTSRR